MMSHLWGLASATFMLISSFSKTQKELFIGLAIVCAIWQNTEEIKKGR